MKGLTANPYLKIYNVYDDGDLGQGKGFTFTDQDQKFRFVLWDDVEEL